MERENTACSYRLHSKYCLVEYCYDSKAEVMIASSFANTGLYLCLCADLCAMDSTSRCSVTEEMIKHDGLKKLSSLFAHMHRSRLCTFMYFHIHVHS